MEYVTYSDFRTKISNDMQLDLDDDTGFITDEELVGYINEAIDDCEGSIHTLGLEAQYFRVRESTRMSLVSGTSEYSLPADIFANKLLAVFYISGNKKYLVERVRNIDETLDFQAGENFKHILLNTTSGIVQKFYPTPQASETEVIERWYIRNVRKVTTSLLAANTIELPECQNFIYQHVKMRIYEKEGSPLLGKAERDLRTHYDLMIQTLREMVPDEDNIIEPDLSHYMDSANDFYF